MHNPNRSRLVRIPPRVSTIPAIPISPMGGAGRGQSDRFAHLQPFPVNRDHPEMVRSSSRGLRPTFLGRPASPPFVVDLEASEDPWNVVATTPAEGEMNIIMDDSSSSSSDSSVFEAAAPSSSSSPFKEVNVSLSAEAPQQSRILFRNMPPVKKKKEEQQPWMVGNVYSWPVGQLFDHIEGATDEEQWMDEGCSSDEDELDSSDEEDAEGDKNNGNGGAKKKEKVKKAVDDILAEMGIPKRRRVPRLIPITSSDEDSNDAFPNLSTAETIKLIRIEDIVMQAVQKYVA